MTDLESAAKLLAEWIDAIPADHRFKMTLRGCRANGVSIVELSVWEPGDMPHKLASAKGRSFEETARAAIEGADGA